MIKIFIQRGKKATKNRYICLTIDLKIENVCETKFCCSFCFFKAFSNLFTKKPWRQKVVVSSEAKKMSNVPFFGAISGTSYWMLVIQTHWMFPFVLAKKK